MNSGFSDFISVQSPQSKHTIHLLVDTEAEICVIKISALKKNTYYDKNDVIRIKGITDQRINSLGSLQLQLVLDNFKIQQKFYIVSDDFPIPCAGILGKNFLKRFHCLIDFDEMSLSIRPNGLTAATIKIKNEVLPGISILPPRCETFKLFKIHSTEFPCIIETQDIEKDIRIATTIAHSNQCWIRVLNTSESVKTISNEHLKVSKLTEYDIYTRDSNSNVKVTRNGRLAEILNRNTNGHARKPLIDLCMEFSDIFHLDGDQPTVNNFYTQHLKLNDKQPVYTPNYRLPHGQKTEIGNNVKKLLKENLIELSISNYNSPLILVPKKSLDGKPKFRMCVDYRKLNRKLIPDRFPLPRIEDIFDNLGKSKFFSIMDLQSGFHQIPLAQNSRKYTAFSTNGGMYQWKVLPFGLSVAPGSFSRMMALAFSGLSPERCFTYMDDLIVMGFSEKHHLQNLRRVFETCRKCCLKLNPEKCQFFKTEVSFLGHICTDEGLKADPKKIAVMQRYPRPNDKESVKRFVAFANYYRRFVENFAKITKPLTNLTKKRVEFQWTEECENAFQLLKRKLIESPILKYPDFSKEFKLIVDASDYACGGVLTQNHDGVDMPIVYISKSFNKAERNKPPIEKELLAVHFAITQFRPYIYGKHFVVKSDHKPLIYLYNLKNPSSRLSRIRLDLEEYDFEIQYIKGTDNVLADALSRITIEDLKNLYGETQILAITRSMTGAATLNNQQAVAAKQNNGINCKNIQIFEDFNTGFTKKIPKLRTTKIAKNSDGSTAKITIAAFMAHSKLFEFSLVKQQVTLSVLFGKLQYVTNTKKITNLQMSRDDKIFQLCRIEDFKSIGNKFLRNLTISIIKPPKKVIDASEKQKLMEKFHNDPLFGGHPGQKRLYAKLRGNYYWKRMTKDIASFISKCENCSMNKHKIYTKEPMVITETPAKPFDLVVIDTIGPLTTSNRGNVYAVTMICDLTKYLVCATSASKRAEDVAKAIFEKFILVHGPMRSIRTDRGTEYTNEMISELCKLMKVEHKISTAYHHQSVGTVERNHQEFNKYIRQYLDSNLQHWDDYLDFFTFCYNIDKHGSNNYKYSPFELVYARSPNMPSDLLSGQIQPLYNHDDYVKEAKFRLQRAHKAATEIMNKLKETNKKYYDKTANPINVKVGDKIYLRTEPYNKLQQLRKPFIITEILDTNVKITDGQKEYLVHKNRINK